MSIFTAASQFYITKKAAFGTGLAGGALATGIFAASAAYTDKSMEDHLKVVAIKEDRVMTDIKDLKKASVTLNDNLILNLRQSGYHGKIKKIEFVNDEPDDEN